jgi:hypothetical protein
MGSGLIEMALTGMKAFRRTVAADNNIMFSFDTTSDRSTIDQIISLLHFGGHTGLIIEKKSSLLHRH